MEDVRYELSERDKILLEIHEQLRRIGGELGRVADAMKEDRLHLREVAYRLSDYQPETMPVLANAGIGAVSRAFSNALDSRLPDMLLDEDWRPYKK